MNHTELEALKLQRGQARINSSSRSLYRINFTSRPQVRLKEEAKKEAKLRDEEDVALKDEIRNTMEQLSGKLSACVLFLHTYIHSYTLLFLEFESSYKANISAKRTTEKNTQNIKYIERVMHCISRKSHVS